MADKLQIPTTAFAVLAFIAMWKFGWGTHVWDLPIELTKPSLQIRYGGANPNCRRNCLANTVQPGEPAAVRPGNITDKVVHAGAHLPSGFRGQ